MPIADQNTSAIDEGELESFLDHHEMEVNEQRHEECEDVLTAEER